MRMSGSGFNSWAGLTDRHRHTSERIDCNTEITFFSDQCLINKH